MKINRKSGGLFQCSSRATYGGSIAGGGGHGHGETISDMTNCNDKPVKVKAGDTMVMISEYDLKAHPLRETGHGGEAGVMGMFRIIFAPGTDSLAKYSSRFANEDNREISLPYDNTINPL
jgi:hypothetical protein